MTNSKLITWIVDEHDCWNCTSHYSGVRIQSDGWDTGNSLTRFYEEIGTCACCKKRYVIDQIPDSGVCASCEIEIDAAYAKAELEEVN